MELRAYHDRHGDLVSAGRGVEGGQWETDEPVDLPSEMYEGMPADWLERQLGNGTARQVIPPLRFPYGEKAMLFDGIQWIAREKFSPWRPEGIVLMASPKKFWPCFEVKIGHEGRYAVCHSWRPPSSRWLSAPEDLQSGLSWSNGAVGLNLMRWWWLIGACSVSAAKRTPTSTTLPGHK